MLYINVKRVMRLRGVENHYDMLLNLGFAPATARKFLRNEVRRMDFNIVEKLCLALDCTPNDLFQWQPSDKLPNPAEKALVKLKRDEMVNMSELLGTLPMEKLERVTDIIQELRDE